MARRKALFLFGSLVLVLVLGNPGLAQRIDTGSGTFVQGVETTTATMVYAPFVSNVNLSGVAGEGSAPIVFESAIIVSNPLAIPAVTPFLTAGTDDEGSVELFCYNFDGGLTYFDTTTGPEVGNGLSEEGTLAPGESWIFLMSEVLDFVSGDPTETFNGHCWLLGHMDGLAGSVTVSSFASGFSQTNALSPGPGQNAAGTIGIPVP